MIAGWSHGKEPVCLSNRPLAGAGIPQVAYCALLARRHDRQCPKTLINTTEEIALTELLLVEHFRSTGARVELLVSDEEAWFSLVAKTHSQIRAKRLAAAEGTAAGVARRCTGSTLEEGALGGQLDDDGIAAILQRYNTRLQGMRCMDLADVVQKAEGLPKGAAGVADVDFLVLDCTETEVERRLLQALLVSRPLLVARLEEVHPSRFRMALQLLATPDQESSVAWSPLRAAVGVLRLPRDPETDGPNGTRSFRRERIRAMGPVQFDGDAEQARARSAAGRACSGQAMSGDTEPYHSSAASTQLGDNEAELMALLSGQFDMQGVASRQSAVQGSPADPAHAGSPGGLSPCHSDELLGLLSGGFSVVSDGAAAQATQPDSPERGEDPNCKAATASVTPLLADSPARGCTPKLYSPGNGGCEQHPSIFERHTARVILAYLRLLLNSRDDLAFLRACDAPSRGFDTTSLKAVSDHGAKLGLPLFPAMLSFCSRVKLGGAGYQPDADEPLHQHHEAMALFSKDFESLNQLILETLRGRLDIVG